MSEPAAEIIDEAELRALLGEPIPRVVNKVRINGRARLLRDAPYFDELTVKGLQPVLAMQVPVEEVSYHCSKAFLRSALWKPETWSPEALPSRAVFSHTLERGDLDELEEYYGPSYADQLHVQRL